jgi:flagellar hook-associated protein 3 FlgL
MAQSLIGSLDRVHYSMQIQSQALAVLQEQASTGSRINRVSDDPLAARDILAMNSQLRSYENYTKQIGDASASLAACSTKIDSITSYLQQAEEETTKAISGLLSSEQRAIPADFLNEMLEGVLADANTQDQGRYIFAGSNTDSPAYTVDRSGGRISAVTYAGSGESREVAVGAGVTAPVAMVGQTTFGGSGTPNPTFPADGSGVTAGTGTSTATGIVWLKVAAEGTGYKLSIDGGATWTTADGSGNQAVTDSRTGSVLYVNTSAVSKEGTDLVFVSGTADVFNTLIGIRDALLSGDEAKVTQIQNRVSEIFAETRQNVLRGSVWAGTKISGLESLKNTLDKMSVDTEDRVAQVQDADIAQVAIDLARYQTLYEMSLTVAAKTLSTNLLDFLST